MVVHAPLRRAVLAGLLVLAGLGSVVATDQALSDPVLTVPATRVGDRGEYVAAVEYRDGSPAGLRAGHWTGQTFEWHDGAVRTDEEGVPHAVRVLETYTTAVPGAGWTSSWAEWSVDAASGETVAVDKRWSNSGASGLLSTTGEWSNVGNTTSFGDGGTLCGMRSSLLDTSGPAPKEALMEGSCTDEAGLGPGGRSLFRLEGRDLLDGHLAYRYAAADGGPVRVWFASGVAAPVQVLQPSVAMEEVRDVMLRLRLVGWQPGASEEALPPVPSGVSPAKPLEWAARDRLLGPAKGALEHPFPHDAAWEVALADSGSGLASFVSAHPDAFLTYLYSYTGFRGALTTFSWEFVVTDGRESLGVRVRHTDPLPGLEAIPFGVPDEVATFTWQTTPLWLPDPDQVGADRLPTIPSMLDRWSLLRGRGVPDAPVYGFAALCQVAGCGEVALWTFAGESTTQFSNATSRGTWDTLFLDLAGQEILLSRQDFQAATAAPLGFGQLAPPATNGNGDRPPASVGTLATQWIASPAGAGTFAAALLVAVLTYLWPTLKQGALALFSRLTPAEIAGHPTRQAILDAVAGSPGIHFQALCRTLDKGRGVVGHHLAKLVASGQVTQHRKGGFTCHFLKGQGAGSLAAVTALKAEGAQRLLKALLATPDRSGLELADATGLSPSTVHYHLRRLQDAGLVVATARGRSLAMRATPDGERAALVGLGGVA